MKRDRNDMVLTGRTAVRRSGSVDEIDRLKWVGSLVRAALIGNDDVACLLWVDASDSVRIRVLEGAMTLGHDSTCELVIPCPGVASRHCRIVHGRDEARIWDLGSLQGTRVNGESVGRDEHPLRDGDVIELGGVPVAFVG